MLVSRYLGYANFYLTGHKQQLFKLIIRLLIVLLYFKHLHV